MTVHAELLDRQGAALGPCGFNAGLSPTRPSIAAALLGLPCGGFTDQSVPPKNPDLIKRMEQADLGPFEAIGLAPAIQSLRAIITDISLDAPAIYDRLGCAEMLGCRFVKGSGTVISPHAWGLAIDLTIDGEATTNGQDAVWDALLQIVPMFNAHGFYWGYDFGLQDALHFEASDELMRKWAEARLFSTTSPAVLPRALSMGDRGPKVLELQTALNRSLSPVWISEDGLFGPETRMAVFALQCHAGLPPTGAAPKPVLAALGLA